MSEVRVRHLALAPSGARRRWPWLACITCGVLALVLGFCAATAGAVSAIVCLLVGVAVGVRAALPEAIQQILLADEEFLRAEHVSAARIVLRRTHGRLVVWSDATDPESFRRLAVQARWGRPGLSR